MTDTQSSASQFLPFCDLVMKGGIASGVVYPTAIAELSKHYRFQSIGGTSAGAIAAAVTAAAEYQRRQTGSLKGFGLLKDLPDQLGKPVAPGTSKLLSLFQPQRELSRLFSVLVVSLNRGSTTSRILHVIIGFMKVYWLATVSATIAGGVAAAGVGLLYGKAFDPITVDVGLYALLSAAILFILFFTITAAGLIGSWVYVDVTRRLVKGDLGLCSGLGQGALTPWLHDLIQTAAGRTIQNDPLTFGDLRTAKGVDSSTPHSIDLQMFSTNLSHGRPYIFPLAENERLYFTEEEMMRCLPEDVVIWMIKKSLSDEGTKTKKGLLELPPPNDFPVVLAARMSLSFPFLFTAIPLHCEAPGSVGEEFTPCWFSDGGISSNFPIHLFDDLLPRWPTFGLTLEPKIDGQSDVFLAKRYDQGYEERWNHLSDDVARKKGAGMLGWFIGAIVGTMQNWNDNSLTRMPGVRDRVARIRLNKNEGGLNLNMEKKHIDEVAARGVMGIQELLERFPALPSKGGHITGWDEHRFVRLHVLLKMLAARAPGVVSAVGLTGKTSTYATDFCKLLKDMQTNAWQAFPPGYTGQMTSQHCTDLLVFVQRLAKLAQEMEDLDKSIPFLPTPTPELRVRPPL